MSFKSEAQRNKLAKLVDEGKFSREKFDAMEKESAGKKLPDRTQKQSKPKGIIRGERRDRK